MSSTRYALMQSPGINSQGYKQVDSETLKALDKMIDQNVRLCLNEFTFFNENQYTVACAVVSAARV
jgi:3-methyladenine DNA glycosylase AlkD